MTEQGTTQLKQGIVSGALRGDELRSIMENDPEFAEKLAEVMESNVADLPRLGSEGKLVASRLEEALAA